jgi:hypothetical protein
LQLAGRRRLPDRAIRILERVETVRPVALVALQPGAGRLKRGGTQPAPVLAAFRSISSACSSTFTCFDAPANDIANGSASAPASAPG